MAQRWRKLIKLYGIKHVNKIRSFKKQRKTFSFMNLTHVLILDLLVFSENIYEENKWTLITFRFPQERIN